jgi:hypothetical protein
LCSMTNIMSTRLRGRVVRRPSLPLTERDEMDLALLRRTPICQQALDRLTGQSIEDEGAIGSAAVSEAALLHAVFQAGLGAIRAAAEDAGYAVMAAEQAEQAAQHQQSRRRRPSWADEVDEA